MPRFFCSAAIFLFALWSNPSLSWTEHSDTRGYVSVARQLSDESARDRPPGYSFFLRLCMLAAGDHWPRLVVGLQTASLAALGVVLLNLFLQFNVPPFFACPAAILICIDP